jgi:hypothetical protein
VSPITVGSLLAAAIAAGTTAAADERRRGLVEQAVDQVPLRSQLHVEVTKNLAPPLSPLSKWGCGVAVGMALAAIIVSLLTSGTALVAAVLALFSLIAGGGIGAQLAQSRGPVNAKLLDLANRARRNAEQLDPDASPELRAALLALAASLERLCQHVPSLSIRMVEAYYTPGRVANILRDGGEDELREWLATAIEPLWEGPEELSRVALLNRIRSEIVAAGGPRITDYSGMPSWIRDLEEWKPAA